MAKKCGHVLHISWQTHQIPLKKVSHFYISPVKSWISRKKCFANWIHEEWQLLDAQWLPAHKPQCRWVQCSHHELVVEADNRGSMFVRLYSGILLFKADKEKPWYCFILLRRKFWKIFKAKSMYRIHQLYLQECQGVQDHPSLPVMTII